MQDNKVNLPKTNFPMRGNLPQREPELINYWSSIKLYNKIRSKRDVRSAFKKCNRAYASRRRMLKI